MNGEQGSVSLDPICGRPVIESASEEVEYKRRRYFFCSPRCRARFERQAERIHAAELARVGALFGERRAHWGLA